MSAHSKLAAVEYVATTTIGEKGQLTVPKEFRDDLGLGPGAPFAVLRVGDGLILLPEQRRFQRLCDNISSALADAGVHPDDLLAALPKARKRVLARHYGRPASKAASLPRQKGRA